MKKKLLAILLALALVLGLCATAVATTGESAISVFFRNIIVTKDGKKVDLKDAQGNPVEPFLYNSSTYLPVRAIAEAIGAKVDWDEKNNTVIIESPEQKTEYIYIPVTAPSQPTQPDPAELLSIVANCKSEAYGKAIHSFTYTVTSTETLMDLTAEDFHLYNAVYDGMEYHDVFDAQATNVYFTANTITVEIEPFYPGLSINREGFWQLSCTNEALSIDPSTTLTYVDPLKDSFVKETLVTDTATVEYYLYTPENADEGPLPLVFFNPGGTGIIPSGDLYGAGANFIMSFAKKEVQAYMPSYVLCPQRNEGDTATAIHDLIQGMIDEGKVDPNRVYISGESAGGSFTGNFIQKYPGFCAAAVFCDPMGIVGNDDAAKVVATSGIKILIIESLGDTTATPQNVYNNYMRLVNAGMEPGVDIIWRYYTAETFNALSGDRTNFAYYEDGKIVNDPVTGIPTYNYPDGKLHNSSYVAANDNYIKMWLKDQSLSDYAPEQLARPVQGDVDYSIIPDRYIYVATVEDTPLVPAGSTGTATVYTDDAHQYWYIVWEGGFGPNRGMQYVECVVFNGVGYVVMDCSGGWWTADVTGSTMPYLVGLEAQDAIDWQPYVRDAE